MNRYEVFPTNAGWRWRYADGRQSKPSALRGDAIAAVRHDRVSGRTNTRGPEAIVLLRADGSLCGELEHEVNSRAASYTHSIKPATEAGKAVS